MAEEIQPKWQGKATVDLKGSTADQIWPFLEEFCDFDKCFPAVDTCYRVEGTPGQPGLVRYCGGKLGWAKEKLLTIDPTNRCLSYEIVESNLGFKNYVGTFKVLPMEEADATPAGCKIQWSFVADSLEGQRLEDFLSYFDNSLQLIAKEMENAIKAQI